MPTNQLKLKIAQSFGNARVSYDNSARLQRFSGQLLLESLPEADNLIAVDLGSGTGFFTEILNVKFDQVIGVDLSNQMLQFSKKHRSFEIDWLNADIHHLPLANNSIDVVYSNLALQWCNPLKDALLEVKRILKPGGVAVFSSLLDGTLDELKQSWSTVDTDDHVLGFKSEIQIQTDIKDSGLSLTNFTKTPLILRYESVKHLAQELKSLGANQVPSKVNKGLLGKGAWQKMNLAYERYKDEKGEYPATYQLFTAQVVNK